MTSPLVRTLQEPHRWFAMFLFDPLETLKKLRALPQFFRNWRAYRRLNRDERFAPRIADIWYRSQDRYDDAGAAHGHYFFQDLWAAGKLAGAPGELHVDVGSRVDGFVSHILCFRKVVYVDIRPLALEWNGFEFRRGSITGMPFADGSIRSLSSLHVIEHVGLGRYGDEIDPEGYLRAAVELARVLAPGGTLLLGTPVGRERVCFDAHRVFAPETIVQAFPALRLVEFSLINDRGAGIQSNAPFAAARACDYGCGLFVFEKPGEPRS
jgi:SAM-dependent methyltransferase